MLSSNLRGGICQASMKYIEANNHYMDDYNPNKPSIFIQTIDFNNLYGHSLKRYLPQKEIRFLDPRLRAEVCDEHFIRSLPNDAKVGYIYEIDGYFPKHLHDFLSDFPPLPEKLKIVPSMLSDFQRDNYPADQLKTKERLVLNLFKKTKYVLHYTTLQLAYSLGLVVTKFHRVIRFVQECFLRPYIEFNTRQRIIASEKGDSFRAKNFKNANNYLYGYTAMQKMKHKNLRIVTTQTKLEKYARSPFFRRASIINEDVVLIEMKKSKVYLDRPLQIAFCVLDYSKNSMYDFYYNHIKKMYPGPRSTLGYMDTDSFLIRVQTEDLYRDMIDHKQFYDFSNYPQNAACFKKLGLTQKEIKELKELNRMVLGKFKDEAESYIVGRLAAICSKQYALEILRGNGITDEKKRNRGIKRKIRDKYLTMNDYVHFLFNVFRK